MGMGAVHVSRGTWGRAGGTHDLQVWTRCRSPGYNAPAGCRRLDEASVVGDDLEGKIPNRQAGRQFVENFRRCSTTIVGCSSGEPRAARTLRTRGQVVQPPAALSANQSCAS